MESYYDLAGGAEGMQKLAEAFYGRVLTDPAMLPLFRDPTEDHAKRMDAMTRLYKLLQMAYPGRQ